jgi:uncharacterized protein (TIGR00295 family)
MDIPSHDESIKILEDAGASKEIIDHSEAVAKLSTEIAELIMGTNMELVEAGALLHDIGRTKSQEIDHAVVGSEIAEELELPETVVKIIRNHIGAGITEEDAEELGLPEGSYIPQTTEEKIVAHADNLIDNANRRGVEDYIWEFVNNEQYRIARRIINLHNKLSELAGMDIDQLTKE